MVWNENMFQKTAASKPTKIAFTNSVLFLENQASGKWHAAVQENKQLPLSRQLTLIKPQNCSTVTLRLYLGHSTNEVFDVVSTRGSPPKPNPAQPCRDNLQNVGFIGVTGFPDVVEGGHMLCNIEVDTAGTMTMRAQDQRSGTPLLIGGKHLTMLKRKVFDPRYKTPK